MQILIIGAGGHGKVVLDILRAGGRYEPVGYLDADPALAGTTVGGLPVLGAANLLPKLRQQQKVRSAIVAIGDNRTRARYAQLLREQGFELINAVHPSAVVSPTARLGANVVVAAGAVICTEAVVGDSTIINTAAIVDHEVQVGDATHVSPGVCLAGRVRVGASAFLGIGAQVLPCLSVGEGATVGAGAVVIRDVPPFATAVGVPARVVKVSPASPQPSGTPFDA
jgi:UDP-perosamine 4-acetyltransferase